MRTPLKKIISASAGTGKTYRLSLEYIALLLEFYGKQEFRPDQILVITFTRKATAEIRERIFGHLNKLGNRSGDWKELAFNLKRDILKQPEADPESPLTESETRLLRDVWIRLSTHKDELQVMTIDSYVHGIFRNLVRPVRGIDRFELDLQAVDKRIPFLFNELMSPALLGRLEKLLSRRLKPALDEYKAFFRSLIDNRWLFYLASRRGVSAPEGSMAWYTNHPELWQARADEYKSNFLRLFGEVIASLDEFMRVKKQAGSTREVIQAGYLNREYIQLFNPLPERLSQLGDGLDAYLEDDYTLLQLLKLLENRKYLWNGQKIRPSKANPEVEIWKSLYGQALQALADYLVFHLFLPEQQEILSIWEELLSRYDKLIYRYKNFTYDDIAWFTFEALYSSEPPLFAAEPEAVANEFYEFMCHRTRFLLIDEFQDTSILQFHILSPLIEELLSGAGSFPYGGLVVVGDEKQSIFGWRGGQRDLLLNLESIFQSGMEAEKDALTLSWRTSPGLMRFINTVFGQPALRNFLRSLEAEWDYTDIEGKRTDLESDTVISFRLDNYSSRSADNKIDRAIRRFVETQVLPGLPVEGEEPRSVAILARRNEELEMIRAILAEHGITSEFQSSKSLLDHSTVKAVFYLLRFAVYHDWYDLLAFLRSDLILLDGASAKQVISLISDAQQQTGEVRPVPDLSSVPKAQAALDLARTLSPGEVFPNCLKVLQACQAQARPALQRDFANLQRFLDLALDYEQNYQSELPGLQGFLRYCEDNRGQEVMQQQDVESPSAIQLLTIHKSKGLEFSSVFVWWNLKSFFGREDSQLSSWVRYAGGKYHNLSDIALSLHYNKVLADSGWNGIRLETERREQLEELNNLYVALTRARSRVCLYAAFDKTGSWEEYWGEQDKADRLTPPHYAVNSALEYMREQGEMQPDGSYLIDLRQPEAAEKIGQEEKKEYTEPTPDLQGRLADWRQPLPAADEEGDAEARDWKQSYLERRDNLKGNIAHYWLAQIKHAEREELEQARALARRQFGNLMRATELDALIDTLERQLPSLKDIFDPRYDLVFTEYRVFDNGREYRLDRLLINTKEKLYRIIDYKTGEVHDDQQLERYNRIVRQKLLPADYKLEQELKPVYIIV